MRVGRLISLDGKKELVRCYSWNEFQTVWLDDSIIERKGKQEPHQYMKLIATFDIETTTIKPKHKEFEPYGFMYIWTMYIGGYAVYGRTWREWLSLLERIKERFELNSDKRLIIWVQNLNFEQQFMTPFLASYFGRVECFATAKRKPIKFTVIDAGFEFRCTYRLSNMNLEAMLKFEKGVKHKKLVGDLDYNIVRTPSTKLTIQEFSYCISDTIGLAEWVKAVLKNNKDTLFTTPVTSTGYVRRDLRKAARKQRGYSDYFRRNLLQSSVYIMLKEAARGGNTHANRAHANRIYEHVDSYDAASMYPFQILSRKMPVSKFCAYGRIDSTEELLRLARKYCLLFRCIIKNPRVKAHVAFPYIPIAKLTEHSGYIVNDNGRVLSCRGYNKGEDGLIYLTLTELDLDIIMREYDYDSIAFYDVHTAKRGMLPVSIRNVVKDYFKKKCELKEEIEELEELDKKGLPYDKQKLKDLKYLYAKIKNRLNGIFGCMFTDVVRDKFDIDELTGEWIKPDKLDEEGELQRIKDALEEYNKSYNSFLIYAHGVYITAWARYTLESLTEACNSIKYGNVALYCDTDSNKALISDDTPIKELNKELIKLAEKTGAYADVKGKRFYMGVMECETSGEKQYKKFITLGAKKYCYTDKKGLHVTVSGVVKDKAPKELKSIENFKKGFTFHKAGGKTLYYNDEPIHTININGEVIETASNIGMVDSTYTLGMTTEYERILKLYGQDY